MNYKFDGNKVFFTSDTHFYHANIINFCKRPFANVETMNEALIENWNAVVGANDIVDRQLPNNIISIHSTNNQRELAEIYSAADLFLNPTREDNYPTVNMEAIACGTPVITFNTGGSPECIDEKVGTVVEYENIDALEKEIVRICTIGLGNEEVCADRAKKFNERVRFQEYVALYERR